MPTLQQIARRISVAEDLGSIVSTMKGLAAVSVRQYERAGVSAQAYIDNLERGFQVVLRHGVDPGAEAPPAYPIGIIIMGTEQGLCGPLNRSVLEYAGRWMADEDLTSDRRRILGIGTRLGNELRAFSLTAEEVLAHPGSVVGVSDRIEDVLLYIDDWLAAGVTAIVAFHHSRATEARARPVTKRILPVESGFFRELTARPWGTTMIPQVAGPPADVFKVLVRQLMVSRLFIAFAEALASEHGERLITMQGAESNIEDRLEALTQEFRREQQTAITSELLDIISGYEAMTVRRSKGSRP